MINISKSFYASGISSAKVQKINTATIIPLGNTPGEKKAASKLAMGSILHEFENTPLPGFTLIEKCPRYTSSEQMWAVIDPRGFKVQITSTNLCKILSVSGITEGLIQEPCVWARENSSTTMELIPISSPLYIEATKNTELLENKINMSDVEIGDRVYLQNKKSGIYLGTFTMYTQLLDNTSVVRELNNSAFHRRQLVEVEPGKVYYSTDLKILKVLEKAETPLTRQESADLLNQRIKNDTVIFSSTGIFPTTYRTHDSSISYVSTTMAKQTPVLSLEEITQVEAAKIFDKATSYGDNGRLVFENPTGRQYITYFPYYGNTIYTTDHYPVAELTNIDPANVKLIPKTVIKYNTRLPYESFKSFTKFYKIVKHLKNESFE